MSAITDKKLDKFSDYITHAAHSLNVQVALGQEERRGVRVCTQSPRRLDTKRCCAPRTIDYTGTRCLR